MLVQSQNTAYKATLTLDVAGDRMPGHFRQEAETSLLRLWGAGPGFLWSDGHWSVVGNLYKEFAARNRPEGYEAVLRLVAVF